MSKKRSRVLVIDASVARAAGETEHPVSSACRRFLRAVLEICHRVAVNEEIRAEWQKHQSRFTRKWRRSMAARKKPLSDIPVVPTGLDLERFAPRHREAVKKDLCLLEAALAADCEIVTLDDALCRALASSPAGTRLRNRITWHNPVTNGTELL